jgi:trehalose/maltose hydrolase-like predicted phosphorylase
VRTQTNHEALIHATGQVPTLGRTFEAVVFEWLGTAVPDERAPAGEVRRRVAALRAAGVDIAVLAGADTDAVDRQLWARRTGPGRLLLWSCDSTRPAQTGPLLRWLAERGIAGGLVLMVGEVFAFGAVPRAVVVRVGSAPAARVLPALLDEQLRRRQHRRVPAVDDDPAWTVREAGRGPAHPAHRRVWETLFTVGAGGLATRGSVEEPVAGSTPAVLASGVYVGNGSGQHLLPGPSWTRLDLRPAPEEHERLLDLRTGVLLREESGPATPLRTLRFASATHPGVVAMRAEAAMGRVRPGPPLRGPDEGQATDGRLDGRRWSRVAGNTAGMSAVAAQRQRRDGGVRTVERIAAYAAATDQPPSPDAAMAALDAAEELGFDRLLAEHRAAWASRWEAVDVNIPDDPAAQLAARFALFHLWCNMGRRDEAAVGARGLSGIDYAGHVFWDADVFVLPALVSMAPAAARAMLTYRLRRLAPARAHARAIGCRGARFPWESAATGEDVTPRFGVQGGIRFPILTGQLEEHITADVAWAADHYATWTGDRLFRSGLGRPLLVETARYWASRCRRDSRGRAHIDGVIGPDEYHVAVTDNAFTNVMARWNLRRAADVVSQGTPETDEARQWRQLAEDLVDGYDPATGLYEQFAGYFKLEPLLAADVAARPVHADRSLGRDRTAATQIIKQPDVLMLHHMVPDEVEPGSLAPNLDFYGPRNSHGSSLSPAISASLLARAGRPNEALDHLRVALFLDIEDQKGTTGGGLHLATMGGVWQALLAGFAGIRVRDGVLCLDPALPSAWPSLGLRFRCLGRQLRLQLTHEDVDIHTDQPLPVQLPNRHTVVSNHARMPLHAD